MSATTIRDVARESVASIATVSRVINNTAEVTQESREQVETVIRYLGYSIPVRLVKTLQKTLRAVGLLMPDINNIYFSAVIRGLETHLFRQDYSLLVCNTDEDPVMEQRYIKTLVEKGVEALFYKLSTWSFSQVLLNNSPGFQFEYDRKIKSLPE